MKRETLGTMNCPECGSPGAEIKLAKSGLLYRWCAQGCNAQFFARNAEQEAAMRRHLTQGSKPHDPEPDPKPSPAPLPPQPQPAKKAGFDLGL